MIKLKYSINLILILILALNPLFTSTYAQTQKQVPASSLKMEKLGSAPTAPTASYVNIYIDSSNVAHLQLSDTTTPSIALSTNNLSFFASTTSAQLLSLITDETGSGALVFGTSPSFTTPSLGAALATSINGLTITTTTGGTLTLANSSSLITSGANPITLTSTSTTNVTLPTSGTLVNSAVTSLSSLSTVGTITSGTWQGTDIAATYLADTAVTPGSYTSANITVDQQGRITSASNGSGGGGISGLTTNYIPKASSSTSIANSGLIESTSRLGYGTATPQQLVHLATSGANSLQYALQLHNPESTDSGGTASGILFSNQAGGTAYGKGGLAFERTGSFGRGYFRLLQNNVADTSNASLSEVVLSVSPSGFVGIADTTPSYPLDITVGGSSQAINISNSGAGTGSALQSVLNLTFDDGSRRISIASASDSGIGTAWNGSNYIYYTGKPFRIINASPTVLFEAHQTTNSCYFGSDVGFGTTTSPSADIDNTGSFVSKPQGNNQFRITPSSDSHTAVFNVTNAGNNTNWLTVDGTSLGRITMNGQGPVMIGLATPVGGKLELRSTTEQLRVEYDASNYTSHTVSSAGDLTIAPTGLDLILSGRQTITEGTITSSFPFVSHTATWNNGGVTFTNLFSNVTDTASASSSLLFDFQVGGSSKGSLRKDGLFTSSGGLNTTTVFATSYTSNSGTYILQPNTTYGAWQANSFSGGTLGIIAGIAINPRTASQSLAGTTDSNILTTNTGASSDVTSSLPAASVGLTYQYAVTVAQNLVVDAAGTDTIRLNSSVTASGGNLTSNTIGNTLTIVCVKSGEWFVMSHEGTWTVN
jgi:hypothetical protein